MQQKTQEARDNRAKELSRMPKHKLARMCATGIRRPDGGRTVIEGAYPVISWDKDEVISSILSVEYPESIAGAS